MAGELRHCPFCAGRPQRKRMYGLFWRRCNKCGYTLAGCRTALEADAAWNTRASPWRPISEAPKDAWVLAWSETGGAAEVRWSEVGACWLDAYNYESDADVFVPLPEDKP